jgi:hypothetical protein
MDDQERMVREHISENPLPILSEHFFMESVANPHYTSLSMSSIEFIQIWILQKLVLNTNQSINPNMDNAKFY